MKKVTIEEIVEYGIESISGDKEVILSRKDFIYLYKTIGELRRFFHNGMHYPDIERVQKYIGNIDDQGMFSVLNKVYIDVLDKYLDEQIEELLESDDLNCPYYPFYYFGNE